jgi:diguanylate cyclase (GGDEF)-like protein
MEPRDPRLAEIELLSKLERDGWWGFEPGRQQPQFGLEALAFRELVHELLVPGCFLGPAMTLRDPPTGATNAGALHAANDRSIADALTSLWQRNNLSLTINHRGRLRLWRLRDELLRERIRDDTGILWAKRHWIPDLRIRLSARDPAQLFTVLRGDLDHFGDVNNEHGHDVGDAAIKVYFRLLLDLTTNAGGEAYRLGGDEVGAILPRVDLKVGRELGEALREKLCTDPDAAKLGFKLTTSLGIATFSGAIDAEAADKHADDLQREAKDPGGRDCVVAKHF